jgi:AraC-like DNA-binding protein
MSPIGDVNAWRGKALLWRLEDGQSQRLEFEWLHERPFGMPLVIMLPRPEDIARTLPLLNYLRGLQPRAVIPEGGLDSPARLKSLLAAPPRVFADNVTSYFVARGMLPTRTLHDDIHRIMALSADVRSITVLAKRMYTSRRTLGRHFAEYGLPVPSHWLQFARLLRACLHLQADDAAIFRIAHRAKYPDGFTMSNQMKRVLGIRPSLVRELVGWEWIVESWLDVERR